MAERKSEKPQPAGGGQPADVWFAELPWHNAADDGKGQKGETAGGKAGEDKPKETKLSTGDTLLTSDAGQILQMPDGRKLAIAPSLDPNKPFELLYLDKEKNVSSPQYLATRTSMPEINEYALPGGIKMSQRPDVTKITFPNKDEIVIDGTGFAQVTRNGTTHTLHEPVYLPVLPPVDPRRKYRI